MLFSIRQGDEKMRPKARPFIILNPLFLTAFCISLVFIFIQNLSKIVFRFDHIWFCAEFEALYLLKKVF
jgi:hypothetical protein